TFITAVLGGPSHRWTRVEQIQWAVDHGKPLAAPGRVFHYSDTGYILLGDIVERVTGMPLGTAFRNLLGYDRNGLFATWLEIIDPDPWMAGDRAHQYFGPTDPYGYDPSFDLYGGGGLAAPVREMALFTRALLTQRVYRSPATLRTMLTGPGLGS